MAILSKADAWKEQQDSLSSAFDSMRKNRYLTDVVLVCEKREFTAHRSYLCAVSPFFRGTFDSGMREAVSGKIELHSVTAEAIEVVLDFVYTGTIPDVEDDVERLENILHATHLLQIQSLFVYCLQRFSEKLSASYFLELWKVAELYDDAQLLDRIPAFLADNFGQVSASTDFVNLNAQQLKQLLRQPDLRAGVADSVIRGILVWAKWAEEERSNVAEELFGLVDLDKLSTRYMDTLLKDPLIQHYLSVFYTLVAKLAARNNEPQPEPKLVCFGKDEKRKVVTVYDVDGRSWSPAKELPLALEIGMAVVHHDNHFFFLGGGDATKPGTQVYKYSLAANTVDVFGNLTKGVSWAGAGILNGSIYVVGGWIQEGSSHVALKTVQRMHLESGACEEMTPTNEGHNMPFVLPFLDHLYVVGSQTGNDKSVERYNFHCNQWTVITKIPGLIDWCRAALCGGKLVIVHSKKETVFYIYDFHTAEWKLTKFTGPNRVIGIWTVHTKYKSSPSLLVRAGNSTLYMYDTELCTWEQVSKANTNPWYWHQTVVINQPQIQL